MTDLVSSPRELTHDGVIAALDAAGVGVWQWNVRTNAVVWSAALERMHGLPPGAFAGTFEAYASDIHPADRDRVFATIERTVSERQPHQLEYRIITPAGDVRWLAASGRLLCDDTGEPLLLTGVCTDISDRRQRQEELEQVQREVAEHAKLAALTADVGFALVKAESLAEMLQRCAQSVVDRLGAAFARIWTLNESEQVLELQTSAGIYTHIDGPHGRVPVGKFKIGLIALERKPHLTNQVVGDSRVGDQEWARREGMVAFAGYPLLVGDDLLGVLAMFARHPLSDGDFQALATVANGVAVGIARTRRTEEVAHTAAQLRESDERFHLVARATNDAIWDWNLGTGTLWWNEGFHGMFGYELSGLEPGIESWTTRIHPDDLERVTMSIHAAIDGDALTWSDEYRFRRSDASYAEIYDRGIIVRDDHGRARRMIGSMLDITARKRSERELQQRADELARLAVALERSNRDLDQFAYVASHDLKAPLRGIANLSQWIEEELGQLANDTVREHLTRLRGRVRRMDALIDGILAYSRAGRVDGSREPVAVRRLVKDVIELLSPPASVEFHIPADLPTIHAERLPLQQVFMNLIGNAVKHASKEDSRIEIGWAAAGHFVEFTISDNGVGIAPAYHEKVWGIFQTLAPRDRVEGTGIGLALVKKIVELRGGRVWLDSAEGRGATFGFSWPLTAAEA